ncbi:MAG: hypothetical protein ACXVX9_04970 [Mycobacteriaceae bacterium]
MGIRLPACKRRLIQVFGLLRGSPTAEQLDPNRTDLVLVVRGFDEVEACSASLMRAVAWRQDDPAVLRHHLRLSADAVVEAIRVAAQEDYLPVEGGPGVDGVLILQRVQQLDALHCSQERSRMVGLAQRLGGEFLGWDGMQAPAVPRNASGR